MRDVLFIILIAFACVITALKNTLKISKRVPFNEIGANVSLTNFK